MDINDPKDILARTLYGEARNQGDEGIKAVACVIINRANDPGWWGKDIISVCLKPFQFSCWNANDPNLPKIKVVTDADKNFAECLQIAHLAVGDALVDITDGATHYYERHLPEPKWANGKTPTITIGDHIFFKIGK